MNGLGRGSSLALMALGLTACAPESRLPAPGPKEHLRVTAAHAETDAD